MTNSIHAEITTSNVHPADALADIRAEIKALQVKENLLREALLRPRQTHKSTRQSGPLQVRTHDGHGESEAAQAVKTVTNLQPQVLCLSPSDFTALRRRCQEPLRTRKGSDAEHLVSFTHQSQTDERMMQVEWRSSPRTGGPSARWRSPRAK